MITRLEQTIPYMTSPNYKERFKAEYYQLALRLEKLDKFLNSYRAGLLDFEPTCSIMELEEQSQAMRKYLAILSSRAKQENIIID